MTVHAALRMNLEAEQGLLGAILINEEAYGLSAPLVSPEDFIEPLHAQIFTEAGRLIESGRKATPVTLKDAFPNIKLGDEPGALTISQYLARLCAEATTIINATDYARLIHDLAVMRGMIAIAHELERAPSDGRNADEALRDAFDKIDALRGLQSGETRGAVSLREAVGRAIDLAAKAYQHDGAVTGLPTGLSDLDGLTGGFHPGDLIILAGRPGMGKSALAQDIAGKVAATGKGVAIYSLEMSHEALAFRSLSAEASAHGEKVPYFAMRSGKFSEATFERIAEAAKRLAELPFYIDDRASITIGDLASSVRRQAKRFERQGHKLALVVVDYLQLMKPGDRYSGSRVNEVTEISGGLKRVARDNDVPVLALSQLSRELERRDNKRPMLSDLRDSGTIEQDADSVIFVYREEYYLKQRMPEEGTEQYATWLAAMEKCVNKMELDVAKQRFGPCGKVELFFDLATNSVGGLS